MASGQSGASVPTSSGRTACPAWAHWKEIVVNGQWSVKRVVADIVRSDGLSRLGSLEGDSGQWLMVNSDASLPKSSGGTA
jgi:hypothetical protein